MGSGAAGAAPAVSGTPALIARATAAAASREASARQKGAPSPSLDSPKPAALSSSVSSFDGRRWNFTSTNRSTPARRTRIHSTGFPRNSPAPDHSSTGVAASAGGLTGSGAPFSAFSRSRRMRVMRWYWSHSRICASV